MTKIIIDRQETKHKVTTIYATVFENGLIEVRRSVRDKLTDNENDMPDNRLNIDQYRKLVELAVPIFEK